MTAKNLDNIRGVHAGVPFEARVGAHFIERKDGYDHGLVEAIVCSSGNGDYVVFTNDGAPPIFQESDLLDEASYLLAVTAWEQRSRAAVVGPRSA